MGKECKTPAELSARLKELFAGTLESMLEAEMEEHIGYEKHSVLGNGSGNSRNGYGQKTVKTEWGEAEIAVPRDRNSSFKPQAVEKRQKRTDDIENRNAKVVNKCLYAVSVIYSLRAGTTSVASHRP